MPAEKRQRLTVVAPGDDGSDEGTTKYIQSITHQKVFDIPVVGLLVGQVVVRSLVNLVAQLLVDTQLFIVDILL